MLQFKHIFCYFLFLVVCHHANSQNTEIMFDLFGGKVWKHKKALLYDTPSLTSGFQLGIYRELKAKDYWSNKWNHPKVGIAYSFLSFGDKEVLGFAHSIFPNAYFTVLNKDKLKLQISAGFGISYLNRTFQVQQNETNNAIGSHINNISKIGFSFMVPSNSFSLRAGVDFTHYSNGGTTSPNSGINVVTANAGMIIPFHKANIENEESTEGFDSKKESKHGINFQYHIGITEDDVLNGPKYLVHASSLAYSYSFSPAYRLYAGIEHEYNFAKFHFELNAFQSREEASRRAQKLIFIVAQEFQLVNFSLRTQIGIYTKYPYDDNRNPFYFKLIPQYQIPLNKLPLVDSVTIGLALKSHYAKAEYLALSFGLNLK